LRDLLKNYTQCTRLPQYRQAFVFPAEAASNGGRMYHGYTETDEAVKARMARRQAQHDAALATQATLPHLNPELTLDDCLQIERELNQERAEKMRAYLMGQDA
jgi:hypothetical protein